MEKCKICEAELGRRNKSGYCKKCYNKNRPDDVIRTRKKNYIKEWLEKGELPTLRNPSITVREFLLERQEGKCAICGMKQEWNDKKLVFILDHIDGNHRNTHENNFRMICPNCDSQLDTFKSKNKNGRKYDREYRIEYYHRNK
jgi:Zn finger protein HypA/HybF involved in hydrogenase expression